jgi:hypothetical protein
MRTRPRDGARISCAPSAKAGGGSTSRGAPAGSVERPGHRGAVTPHSTESSGRAGGSLQSSTFLLPSGVRPLRPPPSAPRRWCRGGDGPCGAAQRAGACRRAARRVLRSLGRRRRPAFGTGACASGASVHPEVAAHPRTTTRYLVRGKSAPCAHRRARPVAHDSTSPCRSALRSSISTRRISAPRERCPLLNTAPPSQDHLPRRASSRRYVGAGRSNLCQSGSAGA